MKYRRRQTRFSYQVLETRQLLATLIAETFESFAGTGFAPSPGAGQLDSDTWRATGLSDGNGVFGGTHASGDFARGLESIPVSSGGVYAFDVGSNRVLGVQPTGSDMTPGTLGMKLTNSTGGAVDEWTISYDSWFRNDQDRSTSVELSYSTDDSNYNNVAELDFTTPTTADANGWTSNPLQATINVTVADGSSLFFRWAIADGTGSGSRDEIGIDEVTISTDGPPIVGGGSVGGVRSLDLRIVSYNVANLPRTSAADADFQTVFSAIGQETMVGVSRDIDLLILQETDPISLDRIEDIMDGLYSQNYAQVISNNFSGDYFGYLYNTETLTLLESENVSGNYTRDPFRAKFSPIGSVDGTADFDVFNVHLNATDSSRRQTEANGIRAELDGFAAGENFMVVGDLNIDSSSEGSYSTLTSNGSGQVMDPIASPGFWNDNNSFKSIHTQNPAGPMDDRFDFQLVNDDVLGNGGLELIPGSYRAFGNNGTHSLNQPITSGNGASSAVLSALADASDHLPVVVDYRFDIAAINRAAVFYNDSNFDGSEDLEALANKSPLLPGQTATFQNYSSYSKGINGLVLEVQDLANVPTLANVGQFFEFSRGNSDDVGSWTTAATPIGVTYQADVDSNGTDRIFLTWADEALKNTWLEITALSNATTGLIDPLSFYFGNAVGETGNDPANAIVNLADLGLARANQTGFGTAEIDNPYDFSRDGRVNLADIGLARENQSGFNPLQLITPGTSGRAGGGDESGKGSVGGGNPGFGISLDGDFDAGDDFSFRDAGQGLRKAMNLPIASKQFSGIQNNTQVGVVVRDEAMESLSLIGLSSAPISPALDVKPDELVDAIELDKTSVDAEFESLEFELPAFKQYVLN